MKLSDFKITRNIYKKQNSHKKYFDYECKCGKICSIRLDGIKNKKYPYCQSCINSISNSLKDNYHSESKERTRLYTSWASMKHRVKGTTKENRRSYSDKNIEVCTEWLEYLPFKRWALYNGYNDDLTLDRKDNDLGYNPNNCRWANRAVQSANTRVLRANNRSGYRGVCFVNEKNKYRASIQIKNKSIFIGYFENPIDGAIARDEYIKDNNLPHTLNFN